MKNIKEILENIYLYRTIYASDKDSIEATKLKFLDSAIDNLPCELNTVIVGLYFEKTGATELARQQYYTRQSIYNKRNKAIAMLESVVKLKFDIG